MKIMKVFKYIKTFQERFLLQKIIVFYLFLSYVIAGFLFSEIVCNKCGHENADEAVTCIHCGEMLVRKENTVSAEIKKSALQDKLKEIINEEGKTADEFFQKGNVDLAALFYRNALAIHLLIDDTNAVPPSWEERTFPKNAIQPLKIKIKCRACGGSGKRTIETVGLDSKTTSVSSGLPCLICNGTGIEIAEEPWKERRERFIEAERQYLAIQKAKRFVRIGGAWVPPTLIEEPLSNKQIAMLKRFCVSPCEKCYGSGRSECLRCKGTGMVTCPNKGCKNGQVYKEKDGELSSGKIRSSEKCPVCKGKGKVICEECRGKGAVTCDKCHGSGERPLCDKCDGNGLVKCPVCNGAGIKDEKSCLNCGGEKVILCHSCNGEGHKK